MNNMVVIAIVIVLYVLVFIVYVCDAYLAYSQRVIIIRLLEELKNAYKDKQHVETAKESVEQRKQWGHQKTVAQPSPEEIAPALRSPPRPQGGFGVVIRPNDSTPIREADPGKIRSEGGEAEDNSPDSATKTCGVPTAAGKKPGGG